MIKKAKAPILAPTYKGSLSVKKAGKTGMYASVGMAVAVAIVKGLRAQGWSLWEETEDAEFTAAIAVVATGIVKGVWNFVVEGLLS